MGTNPTLHTLLGDGVVRRTALSQDIHDPRLIVLLVATRSGHSLMRFVPFSYLLMCSCDEIGTLIHLLGFLLMCRCDEIGTLINPPANELGSTGVGRVCLKRLCFTIPVKWIS